MRPRRIRTPRHRSLALLALLVVAGCGGGERQRDGNRPDATPRLPAPLAAELAARSDAVAASLDADDPCGARRQAEALQKDVIAAVNVDRVPPRYQEELGAAVFSLVASIECVQTPPVGDDDEEEVEDDEEDGDEPEQKDGKRKGKKQ